MTNLVILLDALHIKVLVTPIARDFCFLLGVQPNQLASSRLYEIVQGIQVREPLIRYGKKFGVELLQSTKMLAVQREFLAMEIVLRLHALVDLGLELIDVLVLSVMYIQFILHAG